MNDSAQPTLIHKLRYTPLLDLLRGRLSGRLDWLGIVDSSDLPNAVKSQITRIVRKTKLWRAEQVDVASELVAHFADAMEAGIPADEAISRFGDEKTAICLLRRAKKRNRHWTYHAFQHFGHVVLVLFGIYILLAVYFLMGRPSISTNYVAIMNKDLDDTPLHDQAWPLYRQAILALDRPNKEDKDFYRRFEARPGSKRWEELSSWIGAHRSDLESIHQASIKRIFGFRYGRDGSANDKTLYPESYEFNSAAVSESERNLLVSVLLPHLNDLRHLAMMIRAEAAVARSEGDGIRFVRDMQTLIGVSNHVAGELMVERLVSLGIRAMAHHEIEQAMVESSQIFSSDDLRNLAHIISGPKNAGDLLSFAGERRMFVDIVQRMYTDDGNGEGRMTLQGIVMMQSISQPGQLIPFTETIPAMTITPALLPLMASRKEIMQEYDRLYSIHESNLRRPARDADYRAIQRRISEIAGSPLLQIRYTLIRMIFPSLMHAHWTAERQLAKRDAITIALALERHRRAMGAYPQTLADLTPGLLPRIPEDRADGQALRYKLVDGRPLVYSVGEDQDDDGGKAVLKPDGDQDLRVSRLSRDRNLIIDGDWILYPEPQAKVEEEE